MSGKTCMWLGVKARCTLFDFGPVAEFSRCAKTEVCELTVSFSGDFRVAVPHYTSPHTHTRDTLPLWGHLEKEPGFKKNILWNNPTTDQLKIAFLGRFEKYTSCHNADLLYSHLTSAKTTEFKLPCLTKLIYDTSIWVWVTVYTVVHVKMQ